MVFEGPIRVAILGNSGSGKSTLARRLSRHFGLASLDLDTVAWVPGQVAVPRNPAEALAEVEAFCGQGGGWVLEGCYATLVQAALAHHPVLIFLDPGVEACLAHCRQRPWEPHKYASQEAQDAHLAFLLEWVKGYEDREGELSRRAHQACYEGYGGKKHQLRIPAEALDLEELGRPFWGE